MIILKIIGVTLAVFVLLILAVLALRIKVGISYSPQEKIKVYVKILCFTFGKKKKPQKENKQKKESAFIKWIKSKLGFDTAETKIETEEDAKKKSISDKVTTIVTLITLLADEFLWLLKKMRLDKLKILAVCGDEDAADCAMDYGLVCAAVYPMVGYLTANINTKKNAEEVQIGCDFDGNSYFEFDITVSIRTIHAVRAALRALSDFAEVAADMNTEEAKQ